MKAIKLEVEYDYDFEFIGMISSLKGHKIAWLINTMLKIDLGKDDDLCIDFLNEGKLSIANYKYETEHTNFRLIKNKSIEFVNIASPYLIPELKDYDYFIQISDETENYKASQVIDKIKEVQGIDYITILKTEKLRSIDNLIF